MCSMTTPPDGRYRCTVAGFERLRFGAVGTIDHRH
jgi:hypothetical protein